MLSPSSAPRAKSSKWEPVGRHHADLVQRSRAVSYATLMVYVDVEGKLDGRVSVAADLARRFDAHLIGIASGAPISVVLGEDAPTEAAAQTPHLRDMKVLLDQRGQEFRAAIGTSSRRVEWRSVVGLQADVVAREARAADLVIIGNARASPDPFHALDPGSFILTCRRNRGELVAAVHRERKHQLDR